MAFFSSASDRAFPGWYSSCGGVHFFVATAPAPAWPCPTQPHAPEGAQPPPLGLAPDLLQVEDHALEDPVEALPAPLAPRCWGEGRQVTGGLGQARSHPFPRPIRPRTLPAVRVCVHLSHQGPVLVDGSPGLGSQVQERAGAAATAPADPLDDLGVGVGQLRQRASQLLLVSAGVITSAGAGYEATHPPFQSWPLPTQENSSVCRAGGGGTAALEGCGSPPEAPGAMAPTQTRAPPKVAVCPHSDQGSLRQHGPSRRLALHG